MSTIKDILAKLEADRMAQHTQHLAKAEPKATPMAELFQDAVPPLTEFEQAMNEVAEAKANPKPRRSSTGPNLDIPYVFKGKVGPIQRLSEVPQEELDRHKPLYAQPKAPTKNQELQAVNNARAKAKLGKALTKAEKDLLGKYELPRIVADMLAKSKK